MDRANVTARALAPRAKDLAARSNPQDTRARLRCLRAKLGKHSVKHRASNFIAMLDIVQCECQDVVRPLDRHSAYGISAG
jgi:hypothetical protein